MIYPNLDFRNFDELRPGDNIMAMRLDLINRTTMEVYIFKGTTDSISCALQVNKEVDRLPRLNGISIFNDSLSKKNEESKPFIILKCNETSAQDQFINIIKELLEDFDNSSRDIEVSLLHILSKWRYFFAEPRLGCLSEENIRGLLGELIILERLIKEIGYEALSFWTPDRGEEDFVFNNNILEIKTSINEKHEHVINGIDQLRVTDKVKYICSMLLTPSNDNSGINLPSLITEILNALQTNFESKDIFISKLKERGYDIRDQKFYEAYEFQILKCEIFLVDSNFPKLTTDDLKLPLSSRINKIRYTLYMEGLPSISLDNFKMSFLV